MLNILVCYKWVLDEQDIKIIPGSLQLDTSRAKYKISEYDRNALEEAALLVAKYGGTVTALSFGTDVVKQSLKDVLSRGPEKAYYVKDAVAASADACVTSNVLAAAVGAIGGQFDLILCGEGSADSYSQQVGPRLASLLGIPAITFATGIEYQDSKMLVTRKLGDCVETNAATLPVLVTVLPEINKPRIPGLKQVLGAAKKPTTELALSALSLTDEALRPKVRLKVIKGYSMSRKHIIFRDGPLPQNVEKLITGLSKEGII
jgi:electron transfer flavoprotein beta subunit